VILAVTTSHPGDACSDDQIDTESKQPFHRFTFQTELLQVQFVPNFVPVATFGQEKGPTISRKPLI
jgi:hypothetical protein